MKTPRYLLIAAGLALTMQFCGCATHGYQRASLTRNALDDARQLVAEIQREIDESVASLDELTAPQPGSLRPPFKDFEFTVKRLERDVDRIPKHRHAVRKHADAYYTTWEKELASFETPAIRERSAERRTAVMATLQKVDDGFAALDTSLRPLLLHLRDMNRFLRTDLTMLGVKSGTDLAQRIKADVVDVSKNTVALTNELNQVAENLAPIKRPADVPPATKESAAEPKE